MALGADDGVLGFACDAAATGTTLNYVLAGTDLAAFKLSNAAITVALEEKGAEVANAPLTVAKLVAPDSTASDTQVTGLCPSLGQGWLFLHPKVDDDYGRDTASAATAFASADEVKAAVTAMDAKAAERTAANPGAKAADHAQACSKVVSTDATVPI